MLLTLILMLIFVALNNKVNSMSVAEFNIYPNYLYVYCLQLIAFQFFSLCMLSIVYARHNEMIKILYNAIKEPY